MVSKELNEKVQEAIEGMRSYMQSDGGDLELVSISDNLEVTVRFLGSCGTCPFSAMTLRNGVVEAIKKHAPEIRSVRALVEGEERGCLACLRRFTGVSSGV